ncbi:MAG TPA: hypothetical protein VFQ85_15735 [Mycobacteriales bacterium]|jgi:hypothetical protein|nr:hypothetical protein [Mycobacteriales bacterium]
MKGLLVTTAMVAVVTVAAPASAAVRQRGVYSTDLLDHNATGVRSTISPPNMPQTAVDGAASYTWVGSVLASGDFYQVGWAANWSVGNCGPGIRGVFWTYFNVSGVAYGGCESGHFTAATHRFTMQYNAATAEWVALVDGEYFGGSRTYSRSTSIGTNPPFALAETSLGGSALPSTSDEMGPSTFHAALQTRIGGGWFDTRTAAVYSNNADCTASGAPYNTLRGGFNHVVAGSDYGHPCSHHGDIAW